MKKQYKAKKLHHRIAILITAVIVLLASAASAIFLIRPDIRYFAVDMITHIGTSAELEKEDISTLNLTEYSTDELLKDARVTQNQSMMLINNSNPLASDFEADIQNYKDTDVLMNSCIHEAYASLAAAVLEKFGQKLYVRSAYRTAEEQQEQAENHSDVAAEEGASEHQAGLALDVYVPQFAGMGFIKSEAGQWVNSNCWRYGFIIRYPYYGEAKTGIGYEPWHIRYVGAPHAEIIAKSRITFEEYVEQLEPGAFCRYGEYLITRQHGETLWLPESFASAAISEDNQGNWVVAVREFEIEE